MRRKVINQPYHNNDLVKFWNRVAHNTCSTTVFDDNIFEKFVTDTKAKILDFGCGYGRILNELYKHGYTNSLGIDISRSMLKRGKRNYPYLNFELIGNIPLNFKSATFDVIILCGVLGSIITDEEQLSLIRETYRLLKNDGIIYISDFLITNSNINIVRYDQFALRNQHLPYGIFKINDDTPPFRHHNLQWIKRLVSQFTTLGFREEIFETMNKGKNNGFIFIGQK